MHDQQTIHDAFDFHDPVTGMSAKVTGTRGGPPTGMYVDIEISNKDGRVCGSAIRTISADGKTVDHSGMATNPDFGAVHGQGFATRFNAQAEAVYRAAGVQQIRGVAGSSVGGYAWARAGWQFQTQYTRQEIAQKVTQKGKKYDAATQAKIKEVADNPNATPAHFAMIGHTPGATMWPGKEMMLGTMWEMVKPL